MEVAVRFYVSLVPGSRVESILRSPGAWPGGEAGDVLLVTFTLGGQSFQALNGYDGLDAITLSKTPSNHRGLKNLRKQVEHALDITQLAN